MIKKNIKPLHIILGIIFSAAGLYYLFLGIDILPDNTMPVVGYLDDAAVMFALWVMFKRAQKKLK